MTHRVTRTRVLGIAATVAACAALLPGCAYLSRASEGESGIGGNGRSASPALSADGRWTTFTSDANNLVAGDTNGKTDVFVRDNRDHTVARVSVASSGAEANDNSGVGTVIEFLADSEPSEISDDGRFVVFDSYADNLVTGDTNGQLDVFRHDRDPDADGVFDEPGEIATQLVSANVSGTVGDSLSLGRRVSADGSVVAFTSGASNLLAAPDHDANGTFDVYAATFDTTGALAQVRIISRPASGAPTGALSFAVDMNAAGDVFAFATDDVGILPGDTNGNRDVVVVNTRTGTIRRGTGSVQGDRAQNSPSISDDGNSVAYVTGSTNLAPGDVRDTALDVFVTNLVTGVTTVESRAPSGIEDDGTGSLPKLSADASRVAFISGAIGFIPGDTGGITRLYVRDRLAGRTQVVSTDASLAPGFGIGTMSENGRYIAYFVQPDRIDLDVTVAASAAVGPRDLVVNNAGAPAIGDLGAFTSCHACVTVGP